MERSRDDDACPSALQVHRAADGALVRVRLPGGALTAEQLQTLAELAERIGSGSLELTSRGSVQLRGLPDAPADQALIAEAVAAAGLLPSATHERARNIVASPLSGRVGGLADVRPWVRELDAAILAAPALAGLPGRFWFALDDGRGDVSGLRADAGVQVRHGGRAPVRAEPSASTKASAIRPPCAVSTAAMRSPSGTSRVTVVLPATRRSLTKLRMSNRLISRFGKKLLTACCSSTVRPAAAYRARSIAKRTTRKPKACCCAVR